MSKKVLLLAGDAVEALEVYYPYYRCIEEGIECIIVSPTKKKLQTVVHDFVPGVETYTEKPGYMIESHAAAGDIDPSEFDGLIIPGGRSPEYIRMNRDVQAIAKHFLAEGKPLGVICHGQLVLTAVREYIKDREMTAYTACRPEVEAAGATYIEELIHVDDNIVSGHAWPELPLFMKEFFKILHVEESVNV